MISKSTARAHPTILSASAYYDTELHAREREAVFAREWLFIAHADQLAEHGAYVATTIAGYPLLLINDNGAFRGHVNVCRHRGGPLVWDGDGSCKVLVCRYHGWSYALDGTLQSARDFGDDSLEVASISLAPVRVETWRNLVFANLDADAPPLIDWLGGFARECDAFPIESFRVSRVSSHPLAANWKVYAENYQEGYHIPLVHPGLNRQVDARKYEVDVRDGYCVHRAPARDGAVTAGVWLWRFPSLALNVYPDGMCIESYAPTAAASTQVNYVFCFAEGTPADEVEASIASSDAILEEDRIICEAVQRNYESGAYAGGLLSPRFENGVEYVQSMVLRALERD